MTSWIAGIVGIVVVGVLIDILLPEGDSNKYIKGIYALIVVFIVISPIAKLANGDINIDNIIQNDDTYCEIDDTFVQSVNNDRKNQDIQKITNSLKISGFSQAKVSIFLSTSNIYMIDRVNIDITDCTQNSADCAQKIIDIVNKCVNCEEVKIYDYK